MRSCNHNTALTFQMADRVAQLRNRTQRIKQVNFNSIGCKYIGCNFSELGTVVSAVERNRNRNLRKILEVLFQIVCNTLSSHTNSIFVHTVSTNTHNASQTTCTELKISVKTLLQLFRIVLHQSFNLITCSLIIIFAKPLLRNFNVICLHIILYFVNIQVFKPNGHKITQS